MNSLRFWEKSKPMLAAVSSFRREQDAIQRQFSGVDSLRAGAVYPDLLSMSGAGG
jgi:hypothetical protein